MDLQTLINEAKSQSKDFSNRYDYWVIRRKKTPDLEWLMKEIEGILGIEYVTNAATNYLNTIEDDNEHT